MRRRAGLGWLGGILLLLIGMGTPLGRLLSSGALVLVAPGWLVWQVVGRDLRLPRLVVPALWIALSLSLVPLVWLWSSTLGLRLTPDVLRLIFALLALITSWRLFKRLPPLTVSPPHRVTPSPCHPLALLPASYIFILALVGLTRWWQIQGIATPLWVDGVHHTLLVRLMGETGWLPLSLEPYQPVGELPYHWGYHAMIAAWRAVGGLPLLEGMLWSGQVLNLLVMPVMYALGAYLLRSPRAGLVTAATACLVSWLPAYYVSWGRYTQLTGLLVLPALIIVSVALLERRTWSWRLVLLGALLAAGLFLIHYRVLIFYAAFMLCTTLLLGVRQPRRIRAMMERSMAVAGLTLGLVAPWAAWLAQHVLLPVARTPADLLATATYNEFDWTLLLAGPAEVLIGLAVLGALLALARRNWRALAVAGWTSGLVLIANPWVVGLPAVWLINNHGVIITMFMPLSLLAAYAVEQFNTHWFKGRHAAALLAHAALVLAAWHMRTIVNPQTVLATSDDLRAISWVAAHTPPDARFLTNTTGWLNGAPRGTDGGVWLLPLAGRQTSTPTALYVYGSRASQQMFNDLNQRVAALQPGDQEALHALARANESDYVFVGANSGPITPALVRAAPWCVPVYDQDGVVIAQVLP